MKEFWAVKIDRYVQQDKSPSKAIPTYICWDKSENRYKLGSIEMAVICDSRKEACDLTSELQNIFGRITNPWDCTYMNYGTPKVVQLDENLQQIGEI